MRTFWLAALALVGPAGVFSAEPARPARDLDSEVAALAARIDQRIAAVWGKEVKSAPPADDAEFFRRVSLDLAGRIPSITAIRDFLDDDRPNKRRLWVETLLKKEAHSDHFTNVWRAWLLAQTNQQAQFAQPALEAWLKRHLKNNVPYDQMVRELLNYQAGNQPFAQPGGESPAVFYAANENKPENLAGSTARLFLGIKVECAQCHNHPFAEWKRTQFWEYAAFFTPQSRQGKPGEITIPSTKQVVKAHFLDGAEPQWKEGTNGRAILADWLTARDNPWFARAAVNQMWGYFFGLPLVEEGEEQEGDQHAGHRELLDELAREFVAHGLDQRFLIRTITASQTYQRASALSHPSQKEPRLFARKGLRGLTSEQLFDSLAEATEYRDNTPANPQAAFGAFLPQTPRDEFLAMFSGGDQARDPQTSILQALYLMNSRFIADRTSLARNRTLDTIARQRTSTVRKVETLYLVVLSRKPRPEESERLVQYVEKGGPSRNPAQALADVFWVLLNSPEFVLNH